MPQTDPWDAFPAVTAPVPAAPAFPGVIPGAPKTIDPAEAERLRLAQEAADRANSQLDLTRQNTERANTQQALGSESQGKAAGLLQRAIGANNQYEALGIGARSYLGQKVADEAPDFKNLTDSSKRQQAVAQQRDFISAILRVESGAAVSQSEFENYSKLYFAQPGDTPETLAAKAASRRRAMEALQLQGGVAAKKLVIPPLPSDGGDKQGVTGAAAAPGLGTDQITFGDGGDNGPPPGQILLGYSTGPSGEKYPTYGPDPAIPQEAKRLDAQSGPLGVADLAKQGMTLGLTDEASGIGTSIGRALHGDFNIGANYRLGRDAQELRLNQARDRLGFAGNVAEFVGGAALPAGVLTRAGSALSVGRATTEGAAIGALGGYGYGRGAEGSAINAAGGAVLGGALGYGGQRVGNAIANRAALRVNPELTAAGEAEGVTVNRAMADPGSNNRVTKADATLLGGRRVQQGMKDIEGQVEGRVQAVGRGGQAMDAIGTGDTVKAAGERFIANSGKIAARKYDRAEALAGDAKVTPKESLARVDEMIGKLSETPNTNGNEIAFLNEIKSDLSQDLSVGGLRRMRTKLRQKISKGDLTFGEDEARVLSIMDGAADDIRAGLTAQGKGAAANAFDAADKSYRARMDYINGTVQKLIGKRNATLSAEQIAGKFNSLAKSDSRGLRKFYASLTPEEQADVAATVADQLGHNNKGGFTVSQFLRQTSPKNLSDQTAETIFGPQGAKSIKNLRLLGEEIERVTGAMNSRTSKSGVANYRDWIYSFLAGGGVGGVSGSLTTAGGTAAAGVAAKAGLDVLSARALMSPKLTRWFLTAPRTASAGAIDRHFAQLGEIAKAEPAIAGDIETLRKAIMGAANDNAAAGRLAAEDQDSKKRDRKAD